MTVPPWSYSSLTKYETCPRQYQHVKVLRSVVEPPTEATIWGNTVHEALEARIRDGKQLPEQVSQYEKHAKQFDRFRDKVHVLVEQRFAFDRNLQPCEWEETACWCRGIVDVGVLAPHRASLWDWKTGKVKPDSDQLKLFAAFVMQQYPTIKLADTGFIWLKFGKTTKERYTREQLPVIWEDFTRRSLRLEKSYEQDKWLPKPSGLCNGWCPVGRDRCEFWCPKKAYK